MNELHLTLFISVKV